MTAATPTAPHPRAQRPRLAAIAALASLALAVWSMAGADDALAAKRVHRKRAHAAQRGDEPRRGDRLVGEKVARRGDVPTRSPDRGELRIGVNANTQAWGDGIGLEQDLVQQTGAKWLREEFAWNVIEPKPGEWDWRRYDQLMTEAARRGLHVLPLLMDTPDWAGAAWNSLPDDTAAYAEYVWQVAARYGPNGRFWWENPDLDKSTAPVYFELWNEPYLKNFSTEGASPARYARLVRAAVTAGRDANAEAKFLLEADLSWTDDFNTYREWIDTMYDAVPDLGHYFDAIAVHPYGDRGPDYYTPDGNVRWQVRRLERIRQKFADAGDGEKGIWITELGWTTCSANSDCVSEADQARYYARIADLVRTRYRSYVDALFYYGWHDLGTSPSDKEQHFGIMRRDGTKKPAWNALRSVAAGS
jgi:hypothetical protein